MLSQSWIMMFLAFYPIYITSIMYKPKFATRSTGSYKVTKYAFCAIGISKMNIKAFSCGPKNVQMLSQFWIMIFLAFYTMYITSIMYKPKFATRSTGSYRVTKYAFCAIGRSKMNIKAFSCGPKNVQMLSQSWIMMFLAFYPIYITSIMYKPKFATRSTGSYKVTKYAFCAIGISKMNIKAFSCGPKNVQMLSQSWIMMFLAFYPIYITSIMYKPKFATRSTGSYKVTKYAFCAIGISKMNIKAFSCGPKSVQMLSQFLIMIFLAFYTMYITSIMYKPKFATRSTGSYRVTKYAFCAIGRSKMNIKAFYVDQKMSKCCRNFG